jgi:hypothetical protein
MMDFYHTLAFALFVYLFILIKASLCIYCHCLSFHALVSWMFIYLLFLDCSSLRMKRENIGSTSRLETRSSGKWGYADRV